MTPTHKVTAGVLAGALSVILVWVFEQLARITVPAPVAQSLTVVLTFIVSYWVAEPEA